MKRFLLMSLAGAIGSTLTVTALWFVGLIGAQPIKIEHRSVSPAIETGFADLNTTTAPLNFTAAAEKVMPAVVHIKCTQAPPKQVKKQPYRNNLPDPFRDFFGEDLFGYKFFFEEPIKPSPVVSSGSGVIISEKGYIVTNNHVIEQADDIEVTLYDKRTFKASVTGTDPATDLALIRIREEKLPYLSFVNSDDVKVGEWVLAVGNPFNLTSTVTAGIVSAKARNINILKDKSAIESFIQTDAAVNVGNSGGALVNLDGGLIGINTAIASPTGAYSGYSFAVPSNIVQKVVEDILRYGAVQRGFLGVIIRGVDGNLAKEHELDVTEGVYVDSLLDNSSAGEAGIRPGDVIVSINGQKVRSAPELQELVARHRPGDVIDVMVNRKGKIKSFKVTLRNKEGNTGISKKERSEVLQVLGIELTEPDKKELRKLDIKTGVKVTRIYAGKIRKHTDMREGFIITKIDNHPVASVDDLLRLLENKQGGVLIEGVYPDYPGVYYYAIGL